MILNNVNGTSIRVSDIRNMSRIKKYSNAYYIEIRFKHCTGCYGYGTDNIARDKDFERLNRQMDTLDGIQQ